MCQQFYAHFVFFSHYILLFVFVRLGTGGPTVVTEGKDALLTCVITGSFMNDTVLWRRGNNDILAAGTNRVTTDRRFRVLHDESMFVRFLSIKILIFTSIYYISRRCEMKQLIQFRFI